MKFRLWSIAGLLAACAFAASAPRAVAQGPTRSVNLFLISKSQNKNQVQYAISVDDACAPVAEAPVYAYWRMLERGPNETEPLLAREQRPYGLASQTIERRDERGGEVVIALRALPSKTMRVKTWRAGQGCHAVVTTPIGGAPAHLFNVHASLKWPFGVDYLLISGWSTDGSKVLRERLEP